MPEDLLRGQVPGGPDHGARPGQHGEVRGDGEAEVDEVRLAVDEQHVAGRHVAVHDSRVVHARQPVGKAPGEVAQLLTGERPDLVEAPARDEARHDPGVVRIDVGLEHLDDVRTSDPLQCAELLAEAPSAVRVHQALAQHLDRHGPIVGEDTEEDGAHPALAEPAHQPAAPDARRVIGTQGRHARLVRHLFDGSPPRNCTGGPAPHA